MTFQITWVKWEGRISKVLGKEGSSDQILKRKKKKRAVSRRKEAVNCYIDLLMYEFNCSVSVKKNQRDQKTRQHVLIRKRQKLNGVVGFSWSSYWAPALEWVCFQVLLISLCWRRGEKTLNIWSTFFLTFPDFPKELSRESLAIEILRFSRGSSEPRDRTQVSCIVGGFFTSWATREPQEYWSG